MKKLALAVCLILPILFVSCAKSTAIDYSDDEAISIEMLGDTIKILQLTDLHLTYGIDANDRKTYALIERLVESESWDLVVFSGDMTMSPLGPRLFKKLIEVMEDLGTPWTFIFGNHETDYHVYQDYLALIDTTEHLLFMTGPELEEGGAGNFMIEFTKGGIPFYKAYFLDSHQEREVYTEEEGIYGYLSQAQVEWYENHVQTDTVPSVMFMHIPIRQYTLVETDPSIVYSGIFDEDKVYPQGVDTGIFAAITEHQKTRGIFVGHDHLNDFQFTVEGVLLAYGRASGYNGYGYLEKGGRVIEIDEQKELVTYILLESEVTP